MPERRRDVMPIANPEREVLQALRAGSACREQNRDADERAEVRKRRREQLIHRLCEDRDALVRRVRQLQDGGTDDQHRDRGRAHDDDQAAECLATLLPGRTLVGGYQVGEDLDPGHEGEDPCVPAEGEVKVRGAEGAWIETRQVESLPHYRCDDHHPQKREHARCRGPEDSGSGLRAAIDQPSGRDAEHDGKNRSILEAEYCRAERGDAIGNECHERRHAHQEGERVFDDGDRGVDLHGPTAELLLAEAAAAAAVRDPASSPGGTSRKRRRP